VSDLGEGVRANLSSTGYASATDARYDDDIVPRVDQLFHFQTEAVEVFGPCRPEGADSVAAEVAVLIRYGVRGSPFDVLVHVLDRRIPVARVERPDSPPHQVDVLLRHRPLSIRLGSLVVKGARILSPVLSGVTASLASGPTQGRSTRLSSGWAVGAAMSRPHRASRARRQKLGTREAAFLHRP